MWIKKEEYEFLKEKALKLEDAKIEFANELEIRKIKAEINEQKMRQDIKRVVWNQKGFRALP